MARKKVPIEISVHIRYLHQDGGMRICDIARRYKHIPRRTVAHHAALPIADVTEDRRKFNPGRPRKVTARDDRRVVNAVKYLRRHESQGFTSNRVSYLSSLNTLSEFSMNSTGPKRGEVIILR